MSSQIKDFKIRWGMVIDVDKCTGCGACMVACQAENNLAPVPDASNKLRAMSWLLVYELSNGKPFPEHDLAYLPRPCQQCGSYPCASVCPVIATDKSEEGGIVSQIYPRCTGCRYCMAACPYSAISFNWEKPKHDGTFKNSLNPEVSIPARGTAVKCLFCVHIWKRERQRAAAAGIIDINSVTYTPACAAACPTGAIVFGDLNEPQSEAARLAADKRAFRLPGRVSASPKVWYLSGAQWIKDMMIFKKREGHE